MDRWVLAAMLSRLSMSNPYPATLTPPPDTKYETVLPVRPLTPLRLSMTTAPSPIAQEQVFRCQWQHPDATTLIRPASYHAMVCWTEHRDGNWYKCLLPPSERPRSIRLEHCSSLIGMRIPPAWFTSGSNEPYQPDLSDLQARLIGVQAEETVAPIDGWLDLAFRTWSNLVDKDVAAWADALGISERQLRRKLTTQLGLTPAIVKRLSKIERLLSFAHLKNNLAELACEAGFADQSHMNREVLDATGLTPRAWLQSCNYEVTSLQGCYLLPEMMPSRRLPTTVRRSRRR